jgi:hypothetical protein
VQGSVRHDVARGRNNRDGLGDCPRHRAICGAYSFQRLARLSPVSFQPSKTTPAVFVPKLSAHPPRECDVALVCSHPGCHFVWYFGSELEASSAYSSHEHPDSIRMFQHHFAPTTRALSGMVLWKYVWKEYR